MRTPKFWYGNSFGDKAVATALSPLAALYRSGARLNRNRQPAFQPRAHVLCVGNLTLGGTGKTPIAIALAEIFIGKGAKVAFLSRGYRGRLVGPSVVDVTAHDAKDVGDEPLLLARTAPAIVSRDRAAGAAMADSLKSDIVIMDDGHQNFSLRKDLSLVVFDAAVGIGNGRLFPAGPLREPMAEGLDRANAVIFVGDGQLSLPTFRGPIFRATLIPQKLDGIAGQKLLAFAGIGRPEKFFDTLGEMGGCICATRGFSDHHPYSKNDIRNLRAAAAEHSAHLVTTKKDFVRIAPELRADILVVPIRAVFNDKGALTNFLDTSPLETGITSK